MTNTAQHRSWISSLVYRPANAVLALAITFALATAMTQSAQAQTFTVLHTFNGTDGGIAGPALQMDRAGNLYGVAGDGGNYGSNCEPYGCGTAFKLTHAGSGWIFNILYTFPGGYDGSRPDSQLIFGPDGALYGSTAQGGIGHCGNGGSLPCGMIYRLAPPASFCKSFVCPWNVTVLYRFTGGSDGGVPGEIVFDQAGNIYGPTELGGQPGCSGYFCGTVFKLTPTGGGWTESVLYTFAGGSKDGYWPDGNLVFDHSGNIYGTTEVGGVQFEGTVYQLTPSDSGYTEKLLYQFTNGNSGQGPTGLLLDPSGNLFGTTFTGGLGGCGTAFELTPSDGTWVFLTPYSFSGGMGACGPFVGLIRDAAGNLYGTTTKTGAYGMGAVFKLTPSGYGWTYTSLHDFTGGSDGYSPGALFMDANGNLYGTTAFGAGNNCNGLGCGTVWEITP